MRSDCRYNLYIPKRPHPTFLVEEKCDRLVTTGDWWRNATSSNCLGFVLVNATPNFDWKWGIKLRKPLYVIDDEGNEEKYLDVNDVRLAVNVETMLGTTVFECLLIDHTDLIFA